MASPKIMQGEKYLEELARWQGVTRLLWDMWATENTPCACPYILHLAQGPSSPSRSSSLYCIRENNQGAFS